MNCTVARFLRRKAEAGNYDRYSRLFEDALAETRPWAKVGRDALPDGNLILFHTWGGDGTFPVFIGYDTEGKPACLVVDMFVEPCGAEPAH